MAKMYFDIVLHYTLQVMKLQIQNPHPPKEPITHRLLGAQHRSHSLGPVLHGLLGTGCVCSGTTPAMGIPCWLAFAGEVSAVVGNREMLEDRASRGSPTLAISRLSCGFTEICHMARLVGFFSAGGCCHWLRRLEQVRKWVNHRAHHG